MNEENGKVKSRSTDECERFQHAASQGGEWWLEWFRQNGSWGHYSFRSEGDTPEEIAYLLVGLAILVSAGKATITHLGGLTWLSRPYDEYIQSDDWREKADSAKKRAGGRCQVCNSDEPPLDAHHRTYERLGREQPGDLIVLCRACHQLFHGNGRLAR
jgi:hypothetical protein